MTDPRAGSLLKIALSYVVDFGVAVIPIVPGTKEPPHGFGLRRYFTRLSSERTVRGWFTRKYAGYSIAVVLGDVSDGLVVGDFDDLDSYDRWVRSNPRLAAKLPTVATPRPGRHVFFTADEAELSRDFGRSIIHLGDGELRAGRGYVLVPPSVHPNGGDYQWLIEPGDFPDKRRTQTRPA